jgi:hypothetical protein
MQTQLEWLSRSAASVAASRRSVVQGQGAASSTPQWKAPPQRGQVSLSGDAACTGGVSP